MKKTFPGSAYIEGITGITAEDIAFVSELGYTIKLLGIVNQDDTGTIDVRVHPAILGKSHILSSVNNEFNAVLLKGDAVDDVLLYGKGAGEMPTASAVVADCLDCARDIRADVAQRIPMGFYSDTQKLTVKSIDSIQSRYYLHFCVQDKPGVLSSLASILGENGISIASVMQKEHSGKDFVPVIMLTHSAVEKDVKNALDRIDKLDVSGEKSRFIRIV